MKNQMTRKEAATIMKKYEVNGAIFTPKVLKEEYFIAKRIWNEIVKQDS
jgi:hypothetical protein